MKIQNTFLQGKLNKDIDERLMPAGQYPDALNIRVANTDSSDLGSVENMLGNKLVSDLGLSPTARCIGAYEDGSRGDIYFFVTSSTRDVVAKYNDLSGNTDILLQSMGVTGVLNFSEANLITGINLLVNTDGENDLLFWTDDRNPPRVINVKRFSGSALDSFTEDDISVIKKPPMNAPTAGFTFSSEASLTSLKNEFLSFATRYRYLDGEYSAISSFTYYRFSPKRLDIDFDTMENKGMVNNFNALQIEFNTGSKNVTDIDLVFKRAGSNVVYRVETFNKEANVWGDDETKDYLFIDDKTYTALPQDELFRPYDNVPILAKAQEMVGSRLIYGNYVEGFDIKNGSGEEIDVNYSVGVVSLDTREQEEPYVINVNGQLDIDVSNLPFERGTRIGLNFRLGGKAPENVDGAFSGSLDIIINGEYPTRADFINSPEFFSFIDGTYTEFFKINREQTPPLDSVSETDTPFSYILVGDTLSIQSPTTTYIVDNTPVDGDITDGDTTTVVYSYEFLLAGTTIFSGLEGANASVKTNRSYDVGLVYLDDYGRKSTVLSSETSTVSVKQELSEQTNRLKVSINNEAPAGINRYKIAIKQSRGAHYNIFATEYYEDGQFVWVRLEGTNKDKVAIGDTLIVKADSTGILTQPVEVTVLAIEAKAKNFIEDNRFDPLTGEFFQGGTAGVEIREPAGVYMKVKPIGFNLTYSGITFFEINKQTDHDSGLPPAVDIFAKRSSGEFFPITTNATVTLKITSEIERTSIFVSYEKTYISSQDYTSFQEFYLFEEGLNPLNIRNSAEVFETVPSPDGIYFFSPFGGRGKRRTCRFKVSLSIRNASSITVFETNPPKVDDEIYYETSETFDIINGVHQGNVANQVLGVTPAEVTLGFFNCFSMGGGVESTYYLDGFNQNKLTIDLRPTSTSTEKFKKVRRYSGLTYSEPYNEETNFNGLNEFNLAKANFKDDINKKDGSIQKLYAKDTDLIVFQEDKVNRVLYGKSIIFNADGSSNVSSIEDVLGQHVPYMGEFGISSNPESFAFYGNSLYFTDQKRGSVLKLGGDGIFEISNLGVRNYFRNIFSDFASAPKFGGYDPYHDQYVLSFGVAEGDTILYDNNVKGWTSRVSYKPDFIIGMNNKQYTFHEGKLYEHNDKEGVRNEFYGTIYPSRISTILNQSPSEVKEIQALSLEANIPWDMKLEAYVSDRDNPIVSSLASTDFLRKEGLWYAHARRNENSGQTNSRAVYGLGIITIINLGNSFINYEGGNSSITIGDKLINGTNNLEVGTIVSYQEGIIILDAIVNAQVGDFIYGRKDGKSEGGNLRGYTLKYDLETIHPTRAELYAVNTEVKKSYK